MTGSFVVNAFVLSRMYLELEGWPKPSEEEVRKWEEQRKLRDRISSEMGQYLLKGYKMLDKTCKECAVGCCIQHLYLCISAVGQLLIGVYLYLLMLKYKIGNR